MNKNLKATLITISMILGFIVFMALVIIYPIIVLWIMIGIASICIINISILLWETVRNSLDKKDNKIKPSIPPKNAKKMMITKLDNFFGKLDFDTTLNKELDEKKGPISQKRKPKTIKEWEDEFDIGGNS